jgi:hypothetical protein
MIRRQDTTMKDWALHVLVRLLRWTVIWTVVLAAIYFLAPFILAIWILRDLRLDG